MQQNLHKQLVSQLLGGCAALVLLPCSDRALSPASCRGFCTWCGYDAHTKKMACTLECSSAAQASALAPITLYPPLPARSPLVMAETNLSFECAGPQEPQRQLQPLQNSPALPSTPLDWLHWH